MKGRPARTALASGLVGTGGLTFLGGALHAVVPAVPFLPLAVAQSLVRAPPGRLVSAVVGVLGHWAQTLAVYGTVAALAVAGSVLALTIPVLARHLGRRSALAGAVAFLPLWALAVVLYPQPAPPAVGRSSFALVALWMTGLGGAIAGIAAERLGVTEPRARHAAAQTAEGEAGPGVAAAGAPELRATDSGAPDLRATDSGAPDLRATDSSAPDLTRRYVLGSLGVGGLGLLLGNSSVIRLFGRPDPGEQLLRVPRLVAASAPAIDDAAFETLRGLPPEVTPLAQFYVVDEELFDPDIDPATWRLSIGGLVERPFRLTYEQLKRFPVVERYQTLACISNRVGGDLVSTAKWAGVRVQALLERARVRPGAREVVFRAAGGYSDSLPLEHAMDPSTLIAIGMNGHVLPRAHGFPARLLSVGTYGMKNPKWLTSIEVVDRPYEGFWQRRGWDKEGEVRTLSRIDVPEHGASVGSAATIAGVAFAGDRDIAEVQVSTDAGRTWAPARLRRPLSPWSWRFWMHRWTPVPGTHRVVVRAIDGSGRLQENVYEGPFPAGASGYHAVLLRR